MRAHRSENLFFVDDDEKYKAAQPLASRYFKHDNIKHDFLCVFSLLFRGKANLLLILEQLCIFKTAQDPIYTHTQRERERE